MPYCDQDDILLMLPVTLLNQLADDTAADAVPDPDADPELLAAAIAVVVSGAISAADAEIDSYCAARYAVPFVAVPDIVKAWSVDIAIYNLYGRRDNVAMPDIRKTRYGAAIELLKAVSDGKISLGASEISNSGPVSSSSVSDRLFTIGKSGVSGTLDQY